MLKYTNDEIMGMQLLDQLYMKYIKVISLAKL